MKNTKQILVLIIVLLVVLLGVTWYMNSKSSKIYKQNQELINVLHEQREEFHDVIENTDQSMVKENENQDSTVEKKTTEFNVTGSKEECTNGNCSTLDNQMIVYLPVIEGGEIIFIRYLTEKNSAVLNAVYRELFDAPRELIVDELEPNRVVQNYVKKSGLFFDSVVIDSGIATVKLSGQYQFMELGDWYFRKQINAAAFQYDTVDIVKVELNNKIFDWCITDQSDGEGGCPETPQYWIDAR